MRAEMKARERAARRQRNAVVAVLTALSLLVGGLVFWWPDGSGARDRPLASGLLPTTLGEDWSRGEPMSDWRTGTALEASTTTATSSSTTSTATSSRGPVTTTAPTPRPSGTGTPATSTAAATSTPKGNGPSSKPPNTNRPTKTPRPNAEAAPTDCSLEIFGVCL